MDIWKKIINPNTIVGRSLITVLTSLGTTAALISAIHPIISSNIQKDLQFKIINYTKVLNEHKALTNVLDKYITTINSVVFLKPLVEKIKEEGRNDKLPPFITSNNHIKVWVETLESKIEEQVINTTSSVIDSSKQGLDFYGGNFEIMYNMHTELITAISVCAIGEEAKISYIDYIKDTYEIEKLSDLVMKRMSYGIPQEMVNYVDDLAASIEIGQICIENIEKYFIRDYSVRKALKTYMYLKYEV